MKKKKNRRKDLPGRFNHMRDIVIGAETLLVDLFSNSFNSKFEYYLWYDGCDVECFVRAGNRIVDHYSLLST